MKTLIHLRQGGPAIDHSKSILIHTATSYEFSKQGNIIEIFSGKTDDADNYDVCYLTSTGDPAEVPYIDADDWEWEEWLSGTGLDKESFLKLVEKHKLEIWD